jgi:hypothetical protein
MDVPLIDPAQKSCILLSHPDRKKRGQDGAPVDDQEVVPKSERLMGGL